jgi:hypothetical protein
VFSAQPTGDLDGQPPSTLSVASIKYQPRVTS